MTTRLDYNEEEDRPTHVRLKKKESRPEILVRRIQVRQAYMLEALSYINYKLKTDIPIKPFPSQLQWTHLVVTRYESSKIKACPVSMRVPVKPIIHGVSLNPSLFQLSVNFCQPLLFWFFSFFLCKNSLNSLFLLLKNVPLFLSTTCYVNQTFL